MSDIIWIDPVFDRKEADVLLKRKKGKLSYDDLNRIENNLAYISNKIGLRYVQKDWTSRSLPKQSDMIKILAALSEMCEIVSNVNVPSIPEIPLNHYEKINDIECIQFLIKQYLQAVEDSLTYLCETYAGDMIGVI